MGTENRFEVIIIGGSYAGLSAALTLGRSLRKTLVIDSGKPCNAPTPHSQNFLTHDGKTPAEITAIARKDVEKYKTVTIYDDLAIEGKKTEDGFEITTASGKQFHGSKLIFATGIKDYLPQLEGFAACWGISAIHCPYCHGYEFHGKKTAIWGKGETVMHLAPLVRNLTDQLVILTNGFTDLSEEQTAQLERNGIRLEDKRLMELQHEKGVLKRVVFEDGSSEALDAVYARIPFSQSSDIPAALGCKFSEFGYIEVDGMKQTSVPGVYACGDNSNPMRSVANAVASGNFAGAVVNKTLAEENF